MVTSVDSRQMCTVSEIHMACGLMLHDGAAGCASGRKPLSMSEARLLILS